VTENERLAALASLLPEGRGGLLQWPEEADSTNRVLRSLAEAGAPAGSAVLAEGQTAGRGRLGRRFASPAGKGLYLSWLLRPALPPESLGELPAWAAVAVRRAILRTCGLSAEIKWVNDLLSRGRKLCGILAEGVLREGAAQSVILGIGINVSGREEDFPPELRETATSLLLETGAAPDRIRLAAAVLQELERLLGPFPRGREAVRAEYRKSCATLGRRVTLSDGTEGFAEDIDGEFALLVRLGDGSLRRLRSGEATLHRERNIPAGGPEDR
jgi:BirA family biotin operon repressor/biotin-[acetyl-CoA-carboxylase] ligase